MRGVLARFLWVVVLGVLLSACAGLDSLFATAAANPPATGGSQKRRMRSQALLQGKAIGWARLCVRRRQHQRFRIWLSLRCETGAPDRSAIFVEPQDYRDRGESRRGAIRCGAHRVKCPPCPNPILDGGTDKSRVSSRRCAGGHRCGVRWLSSLNPLAAGARCRPGRGPAIARSQFPC